MTTFIEVENVRRVSNPQCCSSTTVMCRNCAADALGAPVRNVRRPEPLGLPDWEQVFAPEQPEPEQHSGPVLNFDSGGGLPQTDWDAVYNQEAAKGRKPATVSNRGSRSGTPTAFGLPDVDWQSVFEEQARR